MDKLKTITIASITAVVVSFLLILLNVSDIHITRGKIWLVASNLSLTFIFMLVFYLMMLAAIIINEVIAYKMRKNQQSILLPFLTLIILIVVIIFFTLMVRLDSLSRP